MFRHCKKFIALILIASLLFLIVPKPAKADTWGANMMSVIWKQTMEQIVQKIKESIVATLKMQAIKMIQGQLMSLIGKGGAGGGSMVIGDWRQFIYGTANQYSMKMTNDFFRSISQGAPQPIMQRVINPAQKAVLFDSNPDAYKSMKPDLQNYVREGRADMIFQKGWAQNPLVAWNKAAATQNDLAYRYNQGMIVQQTAKEEKVGEKAAEGVAGAGYQSKKSGGDSKSGSEGQITTPGSTTKDMITKVQSMPIDMVALSRSIPEIVASMVTQMLTKMLNQGMSMVSSQISRQLGGSLGNLGGIMGGGGIGNIQNIIQSGGGATSNTTQWGRYGPQRYGSEGE